MNPIDLIIYALATFRVALMFSKEKGPCGMFEGVRAWLCKRNKCLTQGADCLWCWSVWIAALFSAHYFVVGKPDFMVMLMAFSGAAVILNQAFTKNP